MILKEFLEKHVEGYLFNDLRSLKTVNPSASAEGGVGYPLLSATMAGIELMGGLVSLKRFKRASGAGAGYFSTFWKDWLYSEDAGRARAASPVYQLVRHGLAHVYFTKGRFVVTKNDPSLHFTTAANGALQLDACLFADELMRVYWDRVVRCADSVVDQVDQVNRTTMQARLDEMLAEYEPDAEKYPFPTFREVRSLSTSATSSLGLGHTGSAMPDPIHVVYKSTT